VLALREAADNFGPRPSTSYDGPRGNALCGMPKAGPAEDAFHAVKHGVDRERAGGGMRKSGAEAKNPSRPRTALRAGADPRASPSARYLADLDAAEFDDGEFAGAGGGVPSPGGWPISTRRPGGKRCRLRGSTPSCRRLAGGRCDPAERSSCHVICAHSAARGGAGVRETRDRIRPAGAGGCARANSVKSRMMPKGAEALCRCLDSLNAPRRPRR